MVLVPHVLEWKRPSNTGRLATLALAGAELSLFGERSSPFDPLALARDGARHLVLHPGPSALPLSAIDDGRPVRLLVPDGSWQQSTRIANRLCRIEGAARVRVKPRPTIGLRRRPSADRACTAEAIAAALDVLGEREAAEGLRALLDELLRRTRATRGTRAGAQTRLSS